MADINPIDFPATTTPATADIFPVNQGGTWKRTTLGALPVGPIINATTEKTTPVDADMVALVDSEASSVLKKFSWANVKAKLKTYFDTVYCAVTGPGKTATPFNMGMVGVGAVTNYVWNGTAFPYAIDLGKAGSIVGNQGSVALFLGSNYYYADSSYRAKVGGYSASYMRMLAGDIGWATAPVATNAGDAQTFTYQMYLSAAGNLMVGTTSDDGINRLQVAGNTKMTGDVAVSTTANNNTVVFQPSNSAWGNTPVVDIINAAGGRGYLSVSTGGFGIGTIGAYPLGFGTNQTSGMLLSTSNNLLIGSTSDIGTHRLQVTGSSAMLHASGQLRGYPYINSTYGGLIDFGNGAGTLRDRGTIIGLPLLLNPGSERVLIGTTTDDGVNKLQVNGTVIIPSDGSDTNTSTVKISKTEFSISSRGGLSPNKYLLKFGDTTIPNDGQVRATFATSLDNHTETLVTLHNSDQLGAVQTGKYLTCTGSSGAVKLVIPASGNIMHGLDTVAPTLPSNSMLGYQLVSDTQLKMLVKGSDGTVRSSVLTLGTSIEVPFSTVSTYTPTVTIGGGSLTYASGPSGRYCQVGKMVTVTVSFALSAKNSPSGGLTFSLPIPPATGENAVGSVYINKLISTTGQAPICRIDNGVLRVETWAVWSGSAAVNQAAYSTLFASYLANDTQLTATVTYIAA